MSSWRTGYRSERVEYRLLKTSTLQPAGVLQGVESCTLSGSIFSDVRWGGQLQVSGTSLPDFGQYLVHPWYYVTGQEGGAEEGFPLCPPCYVKSPAASYSDAVPVSVSLDLYDVTYRLAKRLKLSGPLAIAAGGVITDTLATRMAATGVRFNITPSSKTLATAMNYDTGDSEMKVLNGLLGALGYWSTKSDFYGVVTAEPYLDPKSRPVDWAFAPGTVNILSPDYTRTLDDFDVPNRITGVSRGTTPIIVTVTLDSIVTSSPYTYTSRGYWVDAEPVRDVDAADAAALTTILTRKLLSLTSVGATNSVTHAWVPEVTLGSLVTSAGLGNVVQKMTMKIDTGLQVKAEWAEVS